MEKMMMPAYYNVLSTEEMTYTEGGATATMSEALLCWLIPPYGWFKGVTAVRDYRRKNPNTWMEKGLDALATDMEKSTANTIRDLASAVFVLILPAKDLLPKVLHLFCQTAHSDSPCGHRVLGRP